MNSFVAYVKKKKMQAASSSTSPPPEVSSQGAPPTQAEKSPTGSVTSTITTRSKTKHTSGGFEFDFDAAMSTSAGSVQKDLKQWCSDEVVEMVGKVFGNSLANNSKKTYSSILKANCLVDPSDVGKVLPCDDPSKLVCMMTPVVGKSWATAKTRMAALSTWHSIHSPDTPFEDVKSHSVFKTFWQGLKRVADQSDYSKNPVKEDDLASMLSELGNKVTNASKRDTAWLVFSFFGVRRISEGCNLRVGEIMCKPNGVSIKISKQKNRLDEQDTFIPHISQDVFPHDPAQIMKDWYTIVTKNYSGAPDAYFFPITKGKKSGKQAHSQSIRSIIKAHYGEQNENFSTQSLRKGGTVWWYRQANGDARLVQSVGHWKSPQVMEAIYLKMTKDEKMETQEKLVQGKIKGGRVPSPRGMPKARAKSKAKAKARGKATAKAKGRPRKNVK